MPKIFNEYKITAKGNVLPIDNFVLFREEKNREINKRHGAELVKDAEAILKEDVPVLKLSVFRQFQLNGNRSNYEGPYFKRRNMAITLAFAEAYERKGRFTEMLCDLLWAIMEESTWIIPAHTYHNPIYGPFDVPPVYGNNGLHGIDLFSAATCATLAFVYHYCKDEIYGTSPVIAEKLLYMLHERAIKPFLSCTFSWSGEYGNKPNNWCPWIISNILVTMALTTKETDLREKVTERSMSILDCFTRDYNSDGGCDEGPSYWGAAGASYFDALETLYDISGGAIDVYSHPLVKAMGEYIVKFNICGKRFVNFADCAPSVVHDGCMIRRFGEKTGSEIMPPFGDEMCTLREKYTASSYHVYRSVRYLISPDRKCAPPKAAKKVWFPDLKVMTARESENPAEGLFFAMKGGHNSESHNHNDIGNVVVYYGGKPVIIDTGVGTYTKQTFSNRRYELWYMQSSYHNLPDIDGVQQKNGAKYRSTLEVYDEDSCSFEVELKEAYLPEADIISYKRRASLNDGVFTLKETMSLEKEHGVVFHFITHVKPEILSEGEISLTEGRILTYPKTLKAEVEEFPISDGKLSQSWGGETLFRINMSAAVKDGEFTFMVK